MLRRISIVTSGKGNRSITQSITIVYTGICTKPVAVKLTQNKTVTYLRPSSSSAISVCWKRCCSRRRVSTNSFCRWLNESAVFELLAATVRLASESAVYGRRQLQSPSVLYSLDSRYSQTPNTQTHCHPQVDRRRTCGQLHTDGTRWNSLHAANESANLSAERRTSVLSAISTTTRNQTMPRYSSPSCQNIDRHRVNVSVEAGAWCFVAAAAAAGVRLTAVMHLHPTHAAWTASCWCHMRAFLVSCATIVIAAFVWGQEEPLAAAKAEIL